MDETNDARVFGTHGEILLQEIKTDLGGKSQRIPVEKAYEQLSYFDDRAYIGLIMDFIFVNLSGDVARKDIEYAYDRGHIYGLDQYLTEILKRRKGLTDEQLRSMRQSELCDLLYQLGCPRLYVFHKTAYEEHKTASTEMIQPSIFINPDLYVARDHTLAYRYVGEGKYEYLAALPLKEIAEAVEFYDQSAPDAQRKKAITIGTTTIDMEHLPADIKARVVEQTRVYKVSPQQAVRDEDMSGYVRPPMSRP